MDEIKELKDIRGIVEVPDYSLFVLISIIICAILFIIILIYALKHKRKKRKKLTSKQIAMNNLEMINFDDTKDAVYTFCENFQYFLDEKNEKAYETLVNELEIYKYKKDIDALSKELETKMKNMIKEIK